jgi:hypothetical protein
MSAKIAERLGSLAVPIGSVTPYPGNPREGDIGAISVSLEAFGQLKPIVVQSSTGHIIAGNHLWKAAVALGWDQIAAVMVEIDDKDATRYLIADNRTQELGTYDQEALSGLLVELARQDALFATGYDNEDLEALLEDLAKAQTGGRGRTKGAGCVLCKEPGERFTLKLQYRLPNGDEVNRGAGSIALCEPHWLEHAAGNMAHPASSFEALKSNPEGIEDACDDCGRMDGTHDMTVEH